jgi:ABC-type phosphate transport system substrate-binding protein
MKKPALRWLSVVFDYKRLPKAILVSIVFFACVSRADAAELYVMVNESVSVTELNRTDLRQIFTGHRQYWSDGTKITVFVLHDNNELHKQFCRDVLQMFPYQLSRLWDQITYSGQGVTPVRVSSYQALIEALESTKGAIGYLETSEVVNLRRVEVEES